MDVADAEVLDLTADCLDAMAVASALSGAGMSTWILPDEKDDPHCAIRRVRVEQIRAVGFRAVRLQERIDWGAGPRCAVSVHVVDLTAIVHREAIPLSGGKNFQMGAEEGRESSNCGD